MMDDELYINESQMFEGLQALRCIPPFIEDCRESAAMGLLVGTPGTGKTTAIQLACKHMAATGGAIPVMKLTGSTITGDKPTKFLKEIGASFPKGQEYRETYYADNIRDITRVMKGNDWPDWGVIIVDEAQKLKPPCLEVLREIHDAVNVGVVMIGNDHFKDRFKPDDFRDNYAHLASRITRIMPRIEGVSEEEVAGVARKRGVRDDRAIAALQPYRRGARGLRHVIAILDKAGAIAGRNTPILSSHITDAVAIIGVAA